jgi:hypothetical protein
MGRCPDGYGAVGMVMKEFSFLALGLKEAKDGAPGIRPLSLLCVSFAERCVGRLGEAKG